MEAVSIVTNGSKVSQKWLAKYGEYLDIMAVSCDSFDEALNTKIGRGTGTYLKTVINLSRKYKEYGIMLKINTVVNRYNFQEDINAAIEEIQPFRWKCFQVLLVPEENRSEHTLRDIRRFLINDDKWRLFHDKHKHQEYFVPESNDVIASSYLLLDEYLHFLNKGVGKPTKSILEIRVAAALKDVYWDEDGFEMRGGIYEWSKSDCSGEPPKPDLVSRIRFRRWHRKYVVRVNILITRRWMVAGPFHSFLLVHKLDPDRLVDDSSIPLSSCRWLNYRLVCEGCRVNAFGPRDPCWRAYYPDQNRCRGIFWTESWDVKRKEAALHSPSKY